MFLGLRTVIYPAPDLAAAKAWYTAVLNTEPYFDESFYVGFRVATVRDPVGSVLEIIENPHFAPVDVPEAGAGPGR